MKSTNKMSKGMFTIFLVLTIVAFIGQTPAQAELWETKTSMPTAPLDPKSGVIDGLHFVVGGGTATIPSTFQVYDPGTNMWTTRTLPPTRRSATAVAVINRELYVVGGCVNSDCNALVTDKLEKYNPDSNSWTALAAMPLGLRGFVAAAAVDGKLHVVGGNVQCGPCTPMTRHEVYDPISNSWQTKASMPAAQNSPAAISVDGKLYVVGGQSSTFAPADTLQVYDPGLNTWTTKTVMPTARAFLTAGVIVGQIYALGGRGPLGTLEAYDPVTNLWESKASMPTPRESVTAGVINNKLYAAGGSGLATMEVYTPTLSNQAPVADAGDDEGVFVGDLVTLDGSGSTDPDGDTITFLWAFTTLPAGSSAVLDDTSSVNPDFTIDTPGTYVISLIVNDGALDSPADTVSISTINVAPSADAGDDESVLVGDLVALDGSGSSDPDGDTITFLWAFNTLPAGSAAVLDDTSSVNPAFTVDKAGTYIINLIVNDGTVDSSLDAVSISTINVAPVADAGDDDSVFVGDLVALDGSGSSDLDGDTITFLWAFTTLPAGSAAVLDDTSSVNPAFTVDTAGTYVASLVVNDGTVDSSPDTVSISTINVAPIADAGGNQSVSIGDTVLLDGSGSTDADLDPLTYSWSLVSIPAGSLAVISNPSAVQTDFDADLQGSYVVSLLVNDGSVNSDPSNITVTALSVEVLPTEVLQNIITIINGFSADEFLNKKMANAVTNKINVVLEKIDQGKINQAINKLENDIIKKTDGCALGGEADKNDWISNCDTQDLIYLLLVDVVSLLL